MTTQSENPTTHSLAGAQRRYSAAGAVPPRASGTTVCEGASPSNTAPANCTKSDHTTRILRTGVDSLYLSYRGDLDPEREAELEALKLLAQSSDPTDQALARLQLHTHFFEVRDKGKGRYPFVLADNWFHLQVARSRAKSLPMIYAQVSSEILTRTGIGPTVTWLNGVTLALGKHNSQPAVSRADLCADFVTTEDLEALPRQAWITRANGYASYYVQGHFSGITIGLGGNLAARLYDKTLEIATKSQKTYLYEFWREAGWDGESPVWRLEFQYGRTVLRELGINTVGDLSTNLPGLWEYATSRWLRLSLPSPSDNTQTRWPNHPLWDVLSSAAWEGDRGEPLYRSRKERLPSEHFLFVNGLGAITSFMAQEGYFSIDQALPAFIDRAHAYHRKQSQHTGKTLTTYARERAQAKARRFNTSLGETSPSIGARERGAKEGK